MIDISDYGATLIDRTITPNEVITVKDWLDGSAQPIFIREQDSFKTIELTFVIDAGSEQDNLMSCSQIIQLFKEQSVLSFEDIPQYTFPVIFEKSEVQRLKPAIWQLLITFKGSYMEGNQTTTEWEDLTSSLVIDNQGTTATPMIISFTIGYADIVNEVITVNGEELPFRNLEAGHTYEFDTSKGTFLDVTVPSTPVSAIDKYVGFVIPKLKVGENIFSASWNVGLDITVTYRLKFI